MKSDAHEFRSGCSIARSLELIGDKWTLLIIRDLIWHEKRTFQALQSSAEHIPTNLLSQRLKKLIEWQLVRREVYQDKPIRYTYHLTEAGQNLENVLLQIMNWGHVHLGGGHYDPQTKRSRPSS